MNTTACSELEKLSDIVRSCTQCPLHEGRTQTVFGSGNSSARIMIVGEAPGNNEDREGLPFVGRAGDNLESLLAHAGLTRDEIYIANVLKCRPPSNRNPHVYEIEQCANYLRAQVALINPEIIVTLGNFATKFILKNEEGITKLRGQVFDCERFKVLPVFHPASALYDRKKMDVLIEDFQFLGRLLAGKQEDVATENIQSKTASGEKPKSMSAQEIAPSSGDFHTEVPEDFDAIAYINAPRNMHIHPGLERIQELMSKLGNPQDELRFVHVAGTNGKGSTCALLESILRQAGYKTGLFTSPYIYSFEERIRVAGAMIPAEDLRMLTWRIKQAAETMSDAPSEFELMTALALLYFAQERCDIVVMEVGLGGRLDSTNIINPLVSVITKLGLDHQNFLGTKLEDIAREKAGIIKQNTPVVSWPQEEAALRVIKEHADRFNAPLSIPQFEELHIETIGESPDDAPHSCISYKQHKNLSLALWGSYQPFNAALTLEVIDLLATKGYPVSDAALEAGCAKVLWPGRFELVSTSPVVIFDGAHNVDGIEALLESLDAYYSQRAVHCVVSLMKDKDYEAMLARLVSRCASLHACSANLDRSLDAESIAACAKKYAAVSAKEGLHKEHQAFAAHAYQSSEEALQGAWRAAGEHDIIVVAGSLYGLAPLKEALDTLKR